MPKFLEITNKNNDDEKDDRKALILRRNWSL